jgi:methionyl-tRNA formyltransferase
MSVMMPFVFLSMPPLFLGGAEMPKIVCIGGKNNIAVNALLYLHNVLGIDKKEICIVPVNNDAGVDEWQKSLIKTAKEINIDIYDIEDIYDIKNIIFISLEYDRIIRPDNFASKYLYNIHFSLLPKYKGMYTSTIPILNGETISGVTLHIIDGGIDTGPIIAQREFAIDINDTAKMLYFKYIENGFTLFTEQIRILLSNSAEGRRQDVLNSSYYKKDPSIFTREIDMRGSSYQIHNNIRALCFNEFQLPLIGGSMISASMLTDEFIGYNQFEEYDDRIIISGIDGYKIIAKKDTCYVVH